MSPVARPFGLALALVLVVAFKAGGAGPAEALFRLVPPDAAATLAIEGLRDHARDFLGSPMADGFRRLPAFRDWVASDRFRQFDQARLRLESVLGEKVATIRDELLGDAVVLALRIPPDGRPEDARGLLLVRVRDRPLLDRLIRGIDEAERQSGEMVRLTTSSRGGVPYWSREFRPGSRRPGDHFTILDDNTFAWSNAEEMVRGVIDRKAGKVHSLADEPNFRRVRGRLPASAASLFVGPGVLGRLMPASVRPRAQPFGFASALLARYLGALEYAGVALEWRDGLVLHAEEIVDPAKLDPWVRRLAAGAGTTGPVPRPRRVPSTALAVASLHVAFPAILDAARALLPAPQQPRIDSLIVALDGVLLGHDLRAEVLPRMGPGVLAYLDPADGGEGAPFPGLAKVMVVGLGGTTDLPAAVDNALRTSLAVYALERARGEEPLRVETREFEGRKVTALRPASPFAYVIDGNRLVVGSSARSVIRDLGLPAVATAGAMEQLRASRFPDADSFACVDLARLARSMAGRRGAILARMTARQGRTVEDAGRDLDQAIASMALFRQAYLTVAIDPDATGAHQTLGLVAHEPATAP